MAGVYVLLPLPAFVAHVALRSGGFRIGGVSFVAVGISCLASILTFSTAMVRSDMFPEVSSEMFQDVEPLLWPANVTLTLLFFTEVGSLVVAAAAFVGALLGSFWSRRLQPRV